MYDSFTLEKTMSMIVEQATKKKWKQDGLYCLDRLIEEAQEMKDAINDGCSEEIIAEEGIDCIYFILQAMADKASSIPPSVAFYNKYESNWVHLKKTLDETGKKVRR